MKNLIDTIVFGLIAKYVNVLGVGDSEKDGCIDIYFGREGHKQSAGFALKPSELAAIRDDIDNALRVFKEEENV